VKDPANGLRHQRKNPVGDKKPRRTPAFGVELEHVLEGWTDERKSTGAETNQSQDLGQCD
jgi:hypothetical protein